jgi:hypothetical protein
LFETVAVAVHLQNMNVVCEPVQQGPGQAFGAEHFRPLVEGKIAGQQGGAAFVPLAEHLEQEFGAGLGYLETLFPPQPFDLLVIDLPAFNTE